VRGDEVLNSEWKFHGVAVHFLAFGAQLMVANPLALLAVIEPDVCVVWSTIVTLSPFGVSNRWVVMSSPECIRKSRRVLGMKCSGGSGLAGAVAFRFWVTDAGFRHFVSA